MSNRSKFFATISCTAIVAFTIGCQSGGHPVAPTAATPAPAERHDTVTSGSLKGYQLPPKSIAPVTNPDPDVQQAFLRMSRIAESQGLIFDGRHTDKGVVIIGKPGSAGPILLILTVYKTQGRVATHDASYATGLDFREGMKMKDQFFSQL